MTEKKKLWKLTQEIEKFCEDRGYRLGGIEAEISILTRAGTELEGTVVTVNYFVPE